MICDSAANARGIFRSMHCLEQPFFALLKIGVCDLVTCPVLAHVRTYESHIKNEKARFVSLQ